MIRWPFRKRHSDTERLDWLERYVSFAGTTVYYRQKLGCWVGCSMRLKRKDIDNMMAFVERTEDPNCR